MRAVDTNILVRLLVRDNPAHVEAAEEFVAPGAWVSHLVLAETLWVLDAVYERGPTQLATAIDLLLDHQNLTLQDADIVRAALVHFRARPSLGFSDCLVLETTRKAGHLPLGTFDKTLARLEGAQRV
ncbi:MAG: PIN domain-containing protein [Betaproteobacteria bacterium]|nr:MAG: PIN domain-containing protein [Betaproteobacteria bacterium]